MKEAINWSSFDDFKNFGTNRLETYSVFSVKFPVFLDFTGNDWC